MIQTYMNKSENELSVFELNLSSCTDELLYSVFISGSAEGYDVKRKNKGNEEKIATFYRIDDARKYLKQCQREIEARDFSIENPNNLKVAILCSLVTKLIQNIIGLLNTYLKDFSQLIITNKNDK